MRIITQILLGAFLLVGSARAASTLLVTNLYMETISNAVRNVDAGGTVYLPPGSATWSNTWTVPNKSFNLIGSGTNNTKIIVKSGLNTVNGLFEMNGISDKTHEFGYFTLDMNVGTAGTGKIIKYGNTSSTNVFRIHNMSFTNFGVFAISVEGWTPALVDKCFFWPTDGAGATGLRVYGLAGSLDQSYYPGGTNIQKSWDSIPLSIGTTNMLYIQGNTFMWSEGAGGGNGFCDCYGGARIAVRDNIGANGNFGGHGTDSTGSTRGMVWFELYRNVITNFGAFRAFSFRGGSGLFATNTIFQTSGSLQPIRLDHYRASGIEIYQESYEPFTGDGIDPGPCCQPYGPTVITNSVYDSDFGVYSSINRDQYGYPAMDQIGYAPPTLWYSNGIVQVQSPLYEWGNTINGNNLGFANGSPNPNAFPYDFVPTSTNIIKLGRDYYSDTAHPSWVPLGVHPLVSSLNTTQYSTGPTMTAVGDVVVPYRGISSAIPVVVADNEEQVIAGLVLTGTSDNQALVPDSYITIINDSLTNRTVYVSVAGGQWGTANVTLTITDSAGLSDSDTFLVTVNEPRLIYGNTLRAGNIIKLE